MKRGLTTAISITLLAGIQIGVSASANASTCTVTGLSNGLSAYCTSNPYFSQYHATARCRVGDIANRFVTATGPTRNAGGANPSNAVRPSGT